MFPIIVVTPKEGVKEENVAMMTVGWWNSPTKLRSVTCCRSPTCRPAPGLTVNFFTRHNDYWTEQNSGWLFVGGGGRTLKRLEHASATTMLNAFTYSKASSSGHMAAETKSEQARQTDNKQRDKKRNGVNKTEINNGTGVKLLTLVLSSVFSSSTQHLQFLLLGLITLSIAHCCC